MTRLENVIADIESVNKEGHAWIYNNDGEIKDDVICGNVLDLLYELKDYEIDTIEKSIDWIVVNADRRWNASIDHNIDVAEMKINGYTYVAIMVHRYGDIRANYTDRFLVRFDNEYEWFELESCMQYKTICDGKYCVNIEIMSECYNVYDLELGESIGEFYEIEVTDLLDAINETVNK